jgi:hypothetical protein
MNITFKEFVNMSYLVEGIDVDSANKIVSINNSHNAGVITNPKRLLSYDINGVKIYSIFKRLSGKGDGNPLIKALKNIDGWQLSNEDRKYIDENIVLLSKELNYDSVVMVASSNGFNKRIVSLLSESPIIDVFNKIMADDVELECSSEFSDKERELLQKAYDNMQEHNHGIFSFKFIPIELRSKFANCSTISTVNYSDRINGKNVLIVDDTVTSGSTISQSVQSLLSTYEPKSVKVLTVFSKLY